jgi:hypothetical protein
LETRNTNRDGMKQILIVQRDLESGKGKLVSTLAAVLRKRELVIVCIWVDFKGLKNKRRV